MHTLDRLPDDILVLVLSALSVQDVLALRSTCRYLYAVSYSPSIWLSLLSHLSLLPLPTTLPSPGQETLERLAISALRLSANWSSPSPVPTECTLIKGARHIDKLELLGEGRWLLALTDGERLSLYDLGSPFPASASSSSTDADAADQQEQEQEPMRGGLSRIFRQPKRVAEYTRSTGRGWHCGFESYLEGEELFVLLSWRNQTDLLRISLSPPPPRRQSQPQRQQFDLLQSFERIRESAPTPTAINGRLLVYPWHSGLLRVVDYRTWEEGSVVTWNPSAGGGVAEGWSREDPLALHLLPQHILVLKPTSLQLFPLPALQISPRLPSHPSASGIGESPRPGPVWHLPFRVDAAVFSRPRLSAKTQEPLSLLMRDVDSWTLVHYRLRPTTTTTTFARPSTSSSPTDTPAPAPAPYHLPPTLITELPELAFAQRDRHNTFALGASGSRGLVQGLSVLRGYTAPWLAAAERELGRPRRRGASPETGTESRRSAQPTSDPALNEILHNTPLRIMEGGNGLSVDEPSGRIAVGEADGDVWVFGFAVGA